VPTVFLIRCLIDGTFVMICLQLCRILLRTSSEFVDELLAVSQFVSDVLL